MLPQTALFTSRFLCLVLASSLAFPPSAIAQTQTPQSAPAIALPDVVLAEDAIKIDGSPTMTIINQLLEDEYEAAYPEVEVDWAANGTETALKKLLAGEIDLAAIARPLSAEEKAQGLQEIPVSLDNIAIVVGRENPFDGALTLEQLRGIFTGQITDWSELGRTPGTIQVIDQPLDSDTRLVLQQYGLVDGEVSEAFTNRTAVEADDTAQIIKALGRNGISYAIAPQVMAQKAVKLVKVAVLQNTLPGDAIYPYSATRSYAYLEGAGVPAQAFLGLAGAAAGKAALDRLPELESTAIAERLKLQPPAIVKVLTQELTTPAGAAIVENPQKRSWGFLLLLAVPLILLGLLLQTILRLFRRPPTVTVEAPNGPAPDALPEQTQPLEEILDTTFEENPAPQPASGLNPATVVPSEPTPVMATSGVEDTADPYQTAVSLLEQGDGAAAEPLLRQAVAARPEFLDGWLALGDLLLKGDRPTEALDSYSEALKLQPIAAAAWLGKGNALLALKNYPEALKNFNTALELRPNLPAVWLGRGLVYRYLGQPNEAQEALDRAQSLGADLTGLVPSELPSPSEPAVMLPLVEAMPAATEATPADATATVVTHPAASPADSSGETPIPPGDGILDGERLPAAPAVAVEQLAPSVVAMPPRDEWQPEILPQILRDNVRRYQGKDLAEASPADIYYILAMMVRDRLRQGVTPELALKQGDRLIGELAAEFMPGPHLPTTLVNLGLLQEVQQALQGLSIQLDELMAQEEEPGLGRGGLGRLMVDYLESCATQGMAAIGYGLRYELGSFDQVIQDGWQVEVPDEWLQQGNPWELERPERAVTVQFGGRSEAYMDDQNRLRMRWQDTETVQGIPYDTFITGYNSRTVSPMRLWQATPTQDISTILYPVDAGYAGKQQRLKQQYFLVSCALQDALRLLLEAGYALSTLPSRITLQLNDTDTILAIPELMRLLMDEHGLGWESAWDLTQRTFAYTNHSLLPEALDWQHYPLYLMEQLLPRHLEIIFDLNGRFLEQLRAAEPHQEALIEQASLIEETGDRFVRMAHLAGLGCYAINGVSELHGELLRQKLMPVLGDRFPHKFTTQTNGISQRRFLQVANPALAALITENIGNAWLADLTALQNLEPLAQDAGFRDAWQQVKRHNKEHLTQLIHERTGIGVNPAALFNVQAAIIHEYKRPHLNLLYVLTEYLRIKADPHAIRTPRVMIYAGKAAPDYSMAKLIIRLIHAIADLINQDATVHDQLRVVFLPNFNLQNSLPIFRAADLAEYISLAGTEAAATGNMIAALNGARLVGTPDGSNLELFQHIGAEHSFSFGLSQAAAASLQAAGVDTDALMAADADLAAVLQTLLSAELSPGDAALFQPLVHRLRYDDPYLTLADYRAYVTCQDSIAQAFVDRDRWTQSAIIATARLGYFAADRAIQSYWQEIWQRQTLAPLTQA